MKINSMNNVPTSKKEISLIAIGLITIIGGILFAFMSLKFSQLLIIFSLYIRDNWVIALIIVFALLIFKKKIWDKK